MNLKFFVPGTPKPAGSKRGFYIEKIKRVVITDACKGSKDWKTDVAIMARSVYTGPPVEGPLRVAMTFVLLRPKNHFGTGSNRLLVKPSAPRFPTTKPDALKLSRAVEDALTSILWRDDSQIVTETLEKRYGEQSGVAVVVMDENGANPVVTVGID